MNQINYSNINCNAKRNVFVHSLPQIGGGAMEASPKMGPGPPLPPLGAATVHAYTIHKPILYTQQLKLKSLQWTIKHDKVHAVGQSSVCHKSSVSGILIVFVFVAVFFGCTVTSLFVVRPKRPVLFVLGSTANTKQMDGQKVYKSTMRANV